MLPGFLAHGGPMIWVLLLAAAVAIVVFIERHFHYHREQINSAEFLNGVRNVLKRDNVVEALAICDATPGPVSRLVKTAILSRERGRDGVREAVESTGALEVPRLEEKLPVLATVAQVAPLLGLAGMVFGFMDIFKVIQEKGAQAHVQLLAGGIWQGLICTGTGIVIGVFCYVGYNYLVTRVNSIVLDMEQASIEVINIVTEPTAKTP